MTEQLTGVIERITFHNMDSGYAVLKVQVKGRRELVTVVGTIPSVVAGEYVEAGGAWVHDRDFGLQFKAETLRTTPPHTTEGIVKYLGSGLIKGIGPHFAKKIVDIFGDRTLEVIDNSPTHLTEVKGIGPQRIQRIRESWQEQKAVRSIMVFLQSFGIGTARAVRIYRTYGEESIDKVRANPYRLSTDIWGVGFKTADELALRMGMPKESPLRAAAAVRYALQSFSEDGHVGCPEPIVVDETRAITGNTIPLEVITQAIETCRLDGEIVRDTPPPDLGPLSEDPWLYLKSMFLAELNVARAIIKLKTGGHPLPKVDVRRELELVARQMKIELAPAQREAIKAATEQKILVITGGPGTGKSTIVRGIVEIFQSKGQRIALCAPTGRAAKRLSESTRMEAKTIHRLLEFDPGTASFRRERGNLLEVDLLVVDEVSMVDIVLMNQLLRAIPPWACVIFVGDVDQLPSVGPGTVLADMIDSGVVPVVCLTEIFRQAGQSWIVQAAHAVNHAEEPVSAPAGGGDFYIIEADTPEIIIDRIVTMVRDRIPARFGFDPFRDVQILTPMNKSELGVASLNKHMQEVLNPKKGTDEVTRFGTTFREGDKVLQTRNNYTKEVFNGDIGRITDVHPDDQELLVDFDGRAVLYEFNELDELTLAYATSIHKSQGSEYPVVIMPVHTQHWVMLQRNLLYTGITRGKKLVVLVGSRKALRIAINKIDTSTRYSLLRWRLQETKAARDESTTED